MRNAVLGDTTARILRATGENVEVHNYIDNTGVQVADVVVGFLHLENKSLDEIRALAERPVTKRGESFDYYCWDLYSRVGAWYEEDKSRLEVRARTLHEIEEGGNQTAEAAEYISSKIVDLHLDTMARLDISYDLLAREGDSEPAFLGPCFRKTQNERRVVSDRRPQQGMLGDESGRSTGRRGDRRTGRGRVRSG